MPDATADNSFREDRLLGIDPACRRIARALYDEVASLPLVCPHGHVDPQLFATDDYRFGSPTDLLLIPDHYIFRMLYSQGVTLEELGIPRRDGGPVATDHLAIWRRFAERFCLFRGTPTGLWVSDSLRSVFGVDETLSAGNADEVYHHLAAQLEAEENRPRRLFERFNIEVLCTTDAANDPLDAHQAIRDSGWGGRVLPTFRPDAVINLGAPGWRDEINRLEEASGQGVADFVSYVQALEQRREFFKQMGATATDHAALTAYTEKLSSNEADGILQRALRGRATEDDARRFTGHMLIEMARMSSEDGLVMQLHTGSMRNHNPHVFEAFGADKGADIPIAAEFTRNLKPLLDEYGNHLNLTLILFTLDETTYARELAPLAGHYPVLRIGPPWWFHDSYNGMRRYFDQVIETAGIYNTAGFNDDTRAFPSIPARHDVWRRASAGWAAEQVVQGTLAEEEAPDVVRALSYDLARDTYRLGA